MFAGAETRHLDYSVLYGANHSILCLNRKFPSPFATVLKNYGEDTIFLVLHRKIH